MITGSKKQILDLVKRTGVLSMDEAVGKTGLAKTTLREHFLQLERDGYLERKYNRSGPGRPKLKFQLTPQGHKIFPCGESDLIRSFLGYLKKRGEESTIEEFFDDYWNKRYEKAERLLKESPKNRAAQLKVLTELLEEEGFMPETSMSEENGHVKVKECNCPFREVVKETRLPCQLEARFYERLFNGDVERTSYMPDGDFCCSYSISDAGTD